MAIITSILKLYLLRGIAEVTFTKVTNGKVRTLICTQNMKFVPTSAWPKGRGMMKNPNIVPVYSFGDADWRSFYINEILKIKKFKDEE